MNPLKITFALLLTLCTFGSITATDLSVRIFSTTQMNRAKFTAMLGQYKVQSGEQHIITDLSVGESVTLELTKEHTIQVKKDDNTLGIYTTISFEGIGVKALFMLSPVPNTARKERYYDDHLDVDVVNNNLCFFNIVDLENYVAGVVQSEVRSISDKIDFYKIQAIISRTYAVAHLRKHVGEGYNLCDDVHCQAYSSRNNSPIILTATVQTNGQILVDTLNEPVSAAFHSNSGGQTVNSEDVWTATVPYLRSVIDTFSLSGRSATWEKKMPVSEFLSILEKKFKYQVNDEIMRDSALTFSQPSRKVFFPARIPLKNIRTAFNLRSTFFDIERTGDTVVMRGRGYGHGVGLSQEGAVQLVELGYSVKDVLDFYYSGASLKDMSETTTEDLGD
ncbi:MAG: SpoIID/LytB domain-containing protein [Bacteroidales bacterium]|jgi:stage II sporulation protein D|nr:SpoIID/LytB domain-containing protein [Bacteroidales bacterium]